MTDDIFEHLLVSFVVAAAKAEKHPGINWRTLWSQSFRAAEKFEIAPASNTN